MFKNESVRRDVALEIESVANIFVDERARGEESVSWGSNGRIIGHDVGTRTRDTHGPTTMEVSLNFCFFFLFLFFSLFSAEIAASFGHPSRRQGGEKRGRGARKMEAEGVLVGWRKTYLKRDLRVGSREPARISIEAAGARVVSRFFESRAPPSFRLLYPPNQKEEEEEERKDSSFLLSFFYFSFFPPFLKFLLCFPARRKRGGVCSAPSCELEEAAVEKG